MTALDRELRLPQLRPRGPGRTVPDTPQPDSNSKAQLTGETGDAGIIDPLGHMKLDQTIVWKSELRGWAETLQQPADGDTIQPDAGNVAVVSGGSYSLGTPPAVPTYQQDSNGDSRNRAWMVVVVDTASSASFSNVSFGNTLKDADGNDIPLSGTTTYVMIYVETIGSWFGFLAGTGH
jgi:hypothetical protein